MRRYIKQSVLLASSFFVADVLLALVPLFIGKLVGALAGHSPNNHLAIIFMWVLIFCSVAHDLTWHFSEFLYYRFIINVSYDYETILFKRIIQKPYPYFIDKFTGKIASYISVISQQLNELTQNFFWNYVSEVVSLITIVVILLSVNWQTGLSFLVGLILMIILGRLTIYKNIATERAYTDRLATKNGKIIDSIANFVNVKSFQKEIKEVAAITREQAITIKAARTAFIWSGVFWGSMGLVVRELIWPATIGLNVYLFIHHRISLAALTTLLSTILLFSTTIWDLIWNFSQFNLKLARIEEAHNYLFGPVNIMRQPDELDRLGGQAVAFNHSLSINNLSFAYPDKPELNVLKDINLNVKKGEKVGIVGRSGSGKTTLTKLMLNYYSSDGIQIDGRPVKTKDLAAMISYVPQDTSLFHRTIAENIAYATDRQVSQEDIVKAAKHAYADEFIVRIPEGYDALVGERGVKLSAGQRQRIAIARAFLDDKPILILDEATSALDSESELLVQQALEDLWQNKNVLAIAHRLSTIQKMDRIIVLDKGKIVEQGSHRELLALNGTYARLWSHQSGGFMTDED